jgi:hypothetical protein
VARLGLHVADSSYKLPPRYLLLTRVTKHTICLIAVLAAAATPILWRTVRISYKLYAASNPQPFTVRQHDEITGPHGTGVIVELRAIAVRSDGSRVDLTLEPRKGWRSRRIAFASGVEQTVYDEVKAVSTFQLSAAEHRNHMKSQLDPGANCLAPINGVQPPRPSVLQATEIRAGIQVVRILNGSGITQWRAPALGCVMLEHFVDWDPAKPGTQTTLLKADSVTLGEPDPALFNVPSDYSEMLPSKA